MQYNELMTVKYVFFLCLLSLTSGCITVQDGIYYNGFEHSPSPYTHLPSEAPFALREYMFQKYKVTCDTGGIFDVFSVAGKKCSTDDLTKYFRASGDAEAARMVSQADIAMMSGLCFYIAGCFVAIDYSSSNAKSGGLAVGLGMMLGSLVEFFLVPRNFELRAIDHFNAYLRKDLNIPSTPLPPESKRKDKP